MAAGYGSPMKGGGSGGGNIRTVANAERPMASAAATGPAESGAEATEVLIQKKPSGGYSVTCVKADGTSTPSDYADFAGAMQYAASEFGESASAAPASSAPATPSAAGPTEPLPA